VIKIEWYEKLDFDENPLELNPMKHDFEPAGLEEEAKELIYRIQAGDMLLIIGKQGQGKTALLKQAIKRFRGKGKLIYVDAKKTSYRLDIEQLLIKKYGLVRGRLLGNKPKNMVLLLDNAHNLSERNNRLIKFYFDQNYLRSVIFTTENPEEMNIDQSIRSRIGKRIIELKPITLDDARQIIKNRMLEEFVTKDTVDESFRFSEGNARDFLLNVEAVMSSEIESPSAEEIRKILKKREEAEKEEETDIFICNECKGALVKIAGEWRCEKCDTFCESCGSLVDEEDEFCPSCGIEFLEEEVEE
jgi:replication-associated recombination protein RarA